ncbi:MAG: uracil-DNA glycosylase [Parcubacteria group bacterium SW_6_46_9]|nr:MAG: uracil-DNA glycosylase [Parcubacteria group bacterium SW_6_46_9]
MSTEDKTEQMRKVKDDVVDLTESPLYEYRQENGYLPVIGEGNHDADIMFIGEAPGKTEAETGRPFCGAAGNLLNKLLSHIDLDRDSVYITNVLKDRPPDNRDPKQKEIDVYVPFLRRQIRIIEPDVIATLGRFGMEFVEDEFGIDCGGTISQVHGDVFTIEEDDKEITFIPLFHPAVGLYDGSQRDTLKEDFVVLQDHVS